MRSRQRIYSPTYGSSSRFRHGSEFCRLGRRSIEEKLSLLGARGWLRWHWIRNSSRHCTVGRAVRVSARREDAKCMTADVGATMGCIPTPGKSISPSKRAQTPPATCWLCALTVSKSSTSPLFRSADPGVFDSPHYLKFTRICANDQNCVRSVLAPVQSSDALKTDRPYMKSMPL